jgi:trk system potassium uptake protein TrkA
VVVLALGEERLEQAVLATMLLRDLGVGRIIARAATDVQAKVLDRLGVSRVIFPERQIGVQVARQILSPSVREMMPIAAGTSLAEVGVPVAFVGKTLGALQLRRDFRLNAVAVRRRREVVQDDGHVEAVEEVDNLPGPDTKLLAGDVLLVVGADESIRAFAAA